MTWVMSQTALATRKRPGSAMTRIWSKYFSMASAMGSQKRSMGMTLST